MHSELLVYWRMKDMWARARVFRGPIASIIWYPIPIFEQQLLGLLFIVVMIFRPKGLIPEKPLRMAGINYKRLMTEESELVSFNQ